MGMLFDILKIYLSEQPLIAKINRGLTYPRRRRLERFVRGALHRTHPSSLRLRLRHAPVLQEAILEALRNSGQIDESKTFHLIRDGVTFICPKCGVFADIAKNAALFSGSEFSYVSYSALGTAGECLAKGKCHGCGRRTIIAHFDPQAYR